MNGDQGNGMTADRPRDVASRAARRPAEVRVVQFLPFEPPPELTYGCVEWFPYEQHEAERRRGHATQPPAADSDESAGRTHNH